MNGRIAGISGVVGGLIQPRAGDIGWRLAFVAAMLVGMAAFGLTHSVLARQPRA